MGEEIPTAPTCTFNQEIDKKPDFYSSHAGEKYTVIIRADRKNKNNDCPDFLEKIPKKPNFIYRLLRVFSH